MVELMRIKDIALKFASWISVEFELYIVKGISAVKDGGTAVAGLVGEARVVENQLPHTHRRDKAESYPAEVTPTQASIIYANEADVAM